MVFKDKLNTNKQNKLVQLYYQDMFTVNANSNRIITISASKFNLNSGKLIFADVQRYLAVGESTIYTNIDIAYHVVNTVISSITDEVCSICIYNGNSTTINIPIIIRLLAYNE